MADDKDKYVKGRGNPRLDVTRPDSLSFTPWSKHLGPEWDKGPSKYDAGGSDKSFATDPNLLKLNSPTADALLKQSAFGRDSSGLLADKNTLTERNKELAARNTSAFVRGKNGLLTLRDPNAPIPSPSQPVPKTEPPTTKKDLSGGGAKSGTKRTKKISSYGRGDPTFKSFSPQVFRQGFYSAAVASAKHFIPQFGLFGTGFHGGAIRIQPMSWKGAFPIVSVQQFDAASAASTYDAKEEEDDE
jgi:hypothetical protein